MNYKPWTEQIGVFPKPDRNSIQAKSCYSCKSINLELYLIDCANGTQQFKAQCKDCGNKSGAIPFEPSAESLGCTVIPFGKHKGKSLSEIADIAPDYLDWLVSNLVDIKLLGTLVLFSRLRDAL